MTTPETVPTAGGVRWKRFGGMIAVTLMSSDMGKLYAALAQAIEKRR